MKIALMCLATALLAAPLYADPMVGFALGANGVWVDEEAQPSDYELGAAMQISVQPNISFPVQAWYGIEHSYARAIGGVHITATDANRQDFSVGLGGEYQFSTEEDIRPQEWRWTAHMGITPIATFPRLLLTAKGAYGTESLQADVLLGVRYVIGGAR